MEDVDTSEEMEPAGPSMLSRATSTVVASRESITAWLPLVAAFAAAALLIWAVISYWPQLRGRVSRSEGSAGTATAPAAERSSSPPAAGTAGDSSPESQLSGWIAVFAPFDVSISEGSKAIALDDRSRAMLSPGQHMLRFQNRALGYDDARVVQIKPTETATINLVPRTGISITSTRPAQVLIDGTMAGDTPLLSYPIDLGTHNVVVRSATGQRQISVTATSKPAQLDVDFSKP